MWGWETKGESIASGLGSTELNRKKKVKRGASLQRSMELSTEYGTMPVPSRTYGIRDTHSKQATAVCPAQDDALSAG